MKKNDFILTGIILLIAIIAFVLIRTVFTKEGGYVEVVIDGKLTETFDLDDNIHYTIDSECGYNKLVIEDGKVYIEEASCPDQLCVKQKTIEKDLESIICLPNKVVIKINSDNSSDLDLIVN